MFSSLLVANRGEVARRIIRSARGLGVRTVAVYSDVDADLPFVAEADEAVRIGPGPARSSYLDVAAVLAAARDTGAAAVHPGYGFLAENPDFATRVVEAGLVWVGPSPEVMRLMADKIRARTVMAAGGMTVGAGSADNVDSAEAAQAAALAVGYPVIVKAAAGGGGMGMAVARDAAEVEQTYRSVASAAARLFGTDRVLVERFVEHARHVEVQLLGLSDGRVVALGTRDCSAQRRHQKIVEEAPAPLLPADLLARMQSDAARAATEVGYRGLGTVECLVDVERPDYVFIEMNTRLQVEHPITELTTGLDLVAEQLRAAAGEAPGFDPDAVRTTGHALEFRLCAEDPDRFLPSAGTITAWEMPTGPGVRVDAGYAAGSTVTPHYDSLLAKLCVWGEDRDDALRRSVVALDDCRIEGVRTLLPLLRGLLRAESFVRGGYTTDVLTRLAEDAQPVPSAGA